MMSVLVEIRSVYLHIIVGRVEKVCRVTQLSYVVDIWLSGCLSGWGNMCIEFMYMRVPVRSLAR
jgi:hypothetical protein